MAINFKIGFLAFVEKSTRNKNLKNYYNSTYFCEVISIFNPLTVKDPLKTNRGANGPNFKNI